MGQVDAELLTCPCCSSKTISEAGVYEICEICGWEDDPTQSRLPDYRGGANEESLNEARARRRQRYEQGT